MCQCNSHADGPMLQIMYLMVYGYFKLGKSIIFRFPFFSYLLSVNEYRIVDGIRSPNNKFLDIL